MRINLEHLRVFYEVAKAGSFATAGRNLNISQSALSRTIQLLEARLGTKLFERHVKGLKLTPPGERLSRFANRMIQEAEMEIKLIDDDASEPRGELKIITTPHMAGSWLIHHMADFIEMYPNLLIDIQGTMGEIDIRQADAIIRPKIPHHPGLIQHHFLSLHMGLFASEAYLARFGVPKKAEDLDNHRIVCFGENTVNPYGNHSWILTVGNTSDRGRTPYLKVNSIEGLINAAEAGLGIAELSADWPSVQKTKLVPVLPCLEGPVVEIYYIYSEKMKNSPRVSALANFLQQKEKQKVTLLGRR